jgi:hypothetical protein
MRAIRDPNVTQVITRFASSPARALRKRDAAAAKRAEQKESEE